MATSKILISNLALKHIGMKPIAALTDLTNPAVRAINTFFDIARDDVLSEHRWPFSTTIGLLAQLRTTEITIDGGFLTTGFLTSPFMSVGSTPSENDIVTGWTYAYAYPARAAQVWCVFNEGTADDKETQEFDTAYVPGHNKRVLVSNLENAVCEYSYKVEDTTIWSPKFAMAMSYRLAAMIAHDLTADASLGLKLMDVAGAYISEAKRISWHEKIRVPRQTSIYQNCR